MARAAPRAALTALVKPEFRAPIGAPAPNPSYAAHTHKSWGGNSFTAVKIIRILKHSQIVAMRSGCLEGSGSNCVLGRDERDCAALDWSDLSSADLCDDADHTRDRLHHRRPRCHNCLCQTTHCSGGSQNTSASSQRNITRCGPRFCHRVDTGNPTLKP